LRITIYTFLISKVAALLSTCENGLLQSIFRIKNVLDAVISVVGLGMVLAIILVFALSLRLRQQEIKTIFQIGCRRMTIARLLSAEVAVYILSG